MRIPVLAIGTAFAMALAAGSAEAQAPAPKIWDIKLGIPISALPLNDFVDTACGTNGGPPALVLKSFYDFAQCKVEPRTGLHEVWFRYDDEMEYVARARRSDIMVRQYQANALAGQPIVTSLLIDDAGIVQGYRVVNDPRADARSRIGAFGLADIFKGMSATPLECVDLPPAEGERPIEDLLVKESCESRSDGFMTRVEARRYYKPGQFAVDPNDSRLNENEFESSARIEVYRPGSAAQDR
jgi:hypothetical protein